MQEGLNILKPIEENKLSMKHLPSQKIIVQNFSGDSLIAAISHFNINSEKFIISSALLNIASLLSQNSNYNNFREKVREQYKNENTNDLKLINIIISINIENFLLEASMYLQFQNE